MPFSPAAVASPPSDVCDFDAALLVVVVVTQLAHAANRVRPLRLLPPSPPPLLLLYVRAAAARLARSATASRLLSGRPASCGAVLSSGNLADFAKQTHLRHAILMSEVGADGVSIFMRTCKADS